MSVAALGLPFAALLLFGARDLVAGLLRLVFLLGNFDNGPGAEEQQQRAEHRHGDLVQAIIIHDRWSPRK